MTIKKQYHSFLQQLKVIYNPSEATTITDWVFESIAGIKRFDVVKEPDQLITSSTAEQLQIALDALLLHKPIQYVTGEAWFYSMKLLVNEHVLIPRPETEELVQLVLDSSIALSNSLPQILDIGTGSGCIAIAIKKNLPAADVSAIDLSKQALYIAAINAATYDADIKFLKVDFLDESEWVSLPMFDIIISNPPYIPINEKEHLDTNVTAYEPHQALFVPNNAPLLFYEKIAAFGLKHLNPNGQIFMEIHEDFGRETAELFQKDYKNVLIKKDIFGKERMVLASSML